MTMNVNENISSVKSEIANLASGEHGEIRRDCPYCKGKDTFSINADTGVYNCFKCSGRGNFKENPRPEKLSLPEHILSESEPVNGKEIPYLITKGVKAVSGLKINEYKGKESLVIPARDTADVLLTVQQIPFEPNGSGKFPKRFLKDYPKKGGFFSIGDENADTFHFCEGLATGLSIHEAVKGRIVCCFDAENMKAVAVAMRGKYPERRFVFCADNDSHKKGQDCAMKSAAETGGLVTMPDETGTDFNDLHKEKGLEAVRDRIQQAKKPSPAKPAYREPELIEIPEGFEENLLEGTREDVGFPYEPGNIEKVREIAKDRPRYQRLRSELKSIRGFQITNYEKELFPKGDAQDTGSIIMAMSKAGWHFAVNDLDDSVECNGRRMSDTDEANIWCHCHDANICTWGKEKLRTVILHTADANRYNPIKDYLTKQEWDGYDHIGAFCDFFKSESGITYPDGTSKAVHDVFIRKWVVGAVAKVLSGYQNPTLVLSGAQELGKSHVASWLCGGIPEYFIEHGLFGDAKDLDLYQCGKFIWEISELDATTRKADVAEIKARITKGAIDVRPPYGRYSIQKPAVASFIATVNSEDFLVDESGNRRFLCMRLSGIDWRYSETLKADQIWAQAVHLFKSGWEYRLDGAEKNFRTEANRGFMQESPLSSYISRYFEVTGDEDDFMTFADIIDYLKRRGIEVKPDMQSSKAVKAAMAELGCQSKQKGLDRKRGYVGIRIRTCEHVGEHVGEHKEINGNQYVEHEEHVEHVSGTSFTPKKNWCPPTVESVSGPEPKTDQKMESGEI